MIRIKVQFSKINTVPCKAIQYSKNYFKCLLATLRIVKIHCQSPACVSIQSCSRFFSPLRMCIPKFLTHLGQLEPCINQDPILVTQVNKMRVIEGPISIASGPSGGMDNSYTGVAPGPDQPLKRDTRSH